MKLKVNVKVKGKVRVKVKVKPMLLSAVGLWVSEHLLLELGARD